MKSTRQGARQYIGNILLQRLFGAVVFFLAAGTFAVPQGIVYFALYFLVSAAACAYLCKAHPEVLAARRTNGPDTKRWDKLLLPLFTILAYYGIYLAAGLSFRAGHPQPSASVFFGGITFMLVSSWLAVWAVAANSHFESSARIQKDREQRVCSTGPYAFVRHPGYAAVILWAAGMPMMFGFWTGMVALVIIALLVVRTRLEDAMLASELTGYQAYRERVRYRLLPLVW